MANEFYANDSSPVKRGDYGVKVARKGYDARYCEDNQLLFNSNWPILQVVGYIKKDDAILLYEETEPIPAGYSLAEEKTFKTCGCDLANIYTKVDVKNYADNNGNHIYRRKLYGRPHNLGYVPMFLPSKILTAEFDVSVMRPYGGYEYLLAWDLDNIDSDVVVFNVDLYEDRDYPYTAKPTDVYFKATDYGIKSGRDGFAVPKGSSSDGVGVSANLQSKMVQAVKSLKTANTFRFYLEFIPGIVTYDYDETCINYYLPKDFDASELEFFGYISGGSTTDSASYLKNIETKYGKVYFMCGYGSLINFDWNRLVYNKEERRISLLTVDDEADLGTDRAMDTRLVVLRSPMSAPEIERVSL